MLTLWEAVILLVGMVAAFTHLDPGDQVFNDLYQKARL